MEIPKSFLLTGAVFAMLGGTLLFLGEIVEAVRPDHDTTAAEFADPLFPLVVGMFLPGIVLLLMSLPALYLVQAHKTAAWGVAAWALLSVGFAFLLVIFGFFGLFGPALESLEPGLLDRAEESTTPVDWIFMVGFPVFLLGLVGFGGVTLWAKVLPRAAAVLVLLGAVLDVLGEMSPVDIPVTGAILAAPGLAWLGFATWRIASGSSGPDAA